MSGSLILFECGHKRVFKVSPPLPGSLIYCVKCCNETNVALTDEEYRVRCTQCIYSRGTGGSIELARHTASKHAVKSKHTVLVKRGEKLFNTIASSDGVIPLFDIAYHRRTLNSDKMWGHTGGVNP